MIKLLLPVASPETVERLLDVALPLARDLDAQVETFHAQPDASLLMPPVFDGATGLSQLGQLLIEMQAQADARAAEIAARVEARRRRDDLPGAARRGLSLAHVVRCGDPDRLIAHRARLADLVVTIRDDDGGADKAVVDSALWRGARPVLLYPAGPVDRRLGRPRQAVLAWNGSAEAAHALSAALPLLENGGMADIVAIDDVVSRDGLADLARYLDGHGIDGRVRHVASHGRSLSEVLFGVAIDQGADLLVMGAYTHSRVREFVLGGVTQQVLADAPLPVLLAH